MSAPMYPNRSDLRDRATKVARTAAKGQAYGEAGKQLAAQRAVPIAASPSDAVPAPQPSGPMPGSLGALDRPTERPTEPITAGVDFGAGPGAMQAGVSQPIRTADPVLERLRVLARQFPNDDVLDLLDSYVQNGY